MKNIFKFLLISLVFTGVLSSCDDKTDLPYVDKPIFKGNFTDGFTGWTTYSETGSQVWTIDPTYGNPNPNNGSDFPPNPCAKISGYSGGNNANVDWLISPAQDLSKYTEASIAFDNAFKFTGPVIEVYVSRDYSGAGSPSVSGVNWTKIEGATLSTGEYKYAFSGLLNISNYTGPGNETVYIAFKYTSTTLESSTWEIDNVKVYGSN
ncbi:choice-of-anchor J domain-containing protein [Flavobacterium sp. CYK-55]|uniref:choice-of-anchor J domain-containing protein n=1 Tax=Flavobacterium sp. CYK-55 TaxID=2835529 RepID=UPI001BCBEA2A|nr:choice-of-anchor J domain-containing protein [Flavobacterium sp. CYK-55]MBS7786109.1 choice-of-anchor J domain-containing protein [Flavobacterium sp. CYK-55]